MLKGGKVVRSGRVDDLKIAPQQTSTIRLDLGETCQCTEWLLNVSYKLKNREGLLPAGHTVAKDQLTLNPYKAPSMELKNVETTNIETKAPVVQDSDANYLSWKVVVSVPSSTREWLSDQIRGKRPRHDQGRRGFDS